VTSTNTIPTPYQIFNQKKGAPYSKKRFYELVKYYHPDRYDQHSSTAGLSYETKLERYRLIVAANELLSCPVKRGAYDTYGAGWNGMPDVLHPRDANNDSTKWGAYNGAGWGGGPRGPSQNATWEDWEKWYQRDAGGPQKPTYVSNSAFVSLVVVIAALGGIGQATRAGNNGASFIEQTDALHHKISQDLMRRRRETANAYGKEERIHHFIKQRDAHGVAAFKEPSPKEEKYRKLMPRIDVCSSEDVKRLPSPADNQN
jgi:curved DNA-binding protein CbpA